MRKKRHIIVGLVSGVAVVSAVGVSILLGSDKPGFEEPARATVVCPIPTAIVEASASEYTRLFPGTVRASQRVELAFSVPGLLEELNAEEGRGIPQGETLAKLDQRDYQYALDMAKAKFENTKRESARCSNLWSQKVITEVQYEDAGTAYDIALAELHMRQKALDDTVLHAPFDGIVVKRHVENHEHIGAKQTIVSFHDISRIEVVIQVPECLLAHGGTEALKALQVRFDTDNDRWFDAVVREHSAKSDGVTQTYDVVVALAPPPDLNVLPGMTATVKVRIAELPTTSSSVKGVTRIPAEALCRGDDGESYVWIIDPLGGKPAKRSVEAARLCEGYVEIHSGLRPSERVAVAGLHTLREDDLVRPMVDGEEGLDG